MNSFRNRLYRTLELKNTQSAIDRIVNFSLLLLILLNVVAVILESVEELHKEYALYFWYFELASVSIFTIEYALRVWTCVESLELKTGWRGRLAYVLSPIAIIDLVAILPFFMSMFFSVDTRILRVLRLLRMFKLSRYFAVLSILGSVLKNESKILVSAIFIMMVLVILSSAGIYALERTVQPEAFGSIPKAMWWATVTLTTVGYGDVVPITAAGRSLGMVITVLGVGMAALPAGIIASGFTSELARRREHYELKVMELAQDGDIDKHDKKQLDKMQDQLGITQSDAQQLLKKVVLTQQMASSEEETKSTEDKIQNSANESKTVCPHCGKAYNQV